MAHTDSAPAPRERTTTRPASACSPRWPGAWPGSSPRCDVWLVATGAEERLYTGSPDHLGAMALARRARAHGARRRLRIALSLDEVGRDRPFWLRSPAPSPRPRVEGAVLGAARRAGVPVRWVRDEGTGNSDHREFELLGLPGAKLGVGAGGEPCRHTPCDRPSRLDRTSLRLARRVVEGAVRSESMPVVREHRHASLCKSGRRMSALLARVVRPRTRVVIIGLWLVAVFACFCVQPAGQVLGRGAQRVQLLPPERRRIHPRARGHQAPDARRAGGHGDRVPPRGRSHGRGPAADRRERGAPQRASLPPAPAHPRSRLPPGRGIAGSHRRAGHGQHHLERRIGDDRRPGQGRPGHRGHGRRRPRDTRDRPRRLLGRRDQGLRADQRLTGRRGRSCSSSCC